MASFVLLEHDFSHVGPLAGIHWDLIIEAEPARRLPTWRLSANPTRIDTPIVADRIADHRREYLDYEGDISGGRGFVTREDRGSVTVHWLDGEEARFSVGGELWRGDYEIVRTPRALLLRRMRTNP